jgi:alpha-L-fucosidase
MLKSRVPECHWDFLTPEYISYREAKDYKWETTRGIGRSFGYNQIETEKDMISSEELIRLFVDIVSKNGNLLINVGPMADGTIPHMQQKPLKGLGAWLKVNGEALYDTSPWTRAEGKTVDGPDIRYTKKGDDLYAILLDSPMGNDVSMLQMEIDKDSEIHLLGHDRELGWKQEGDRLTVSFPQGVQESPAYAFHIRRRNMEIRS